MRYLLQVLPPQWCPLHTLGPRSTIFLDPWGACERDFQWSACILDVGLCGSCWWAVPPPRSLTLQVFITDISESGVLLSTWDSSDYYGWVVFAWCLDDQGSCFSARGKQGAVWSGNQVPLSHTEKQEGLTPVAQKSWHKFLICKWKPNEET